MLFLAGVATLNLGHTVLGGATKSVTLFDDFLGLGHPGGLLEVNLGVYLDFYSSYMVWVVFVISSLVHLYSTMYMGGDPRVYLFLSYLTLFTFFMVVLLVSPNYVQLFMGWEGVGLTSYLLVNFWHTRVQANKSALKALIVNRVGDLFFLYALFLLVKHGDTLSFVDLSGERHPGTALFVVAAAAAKSAQLGLHTWLPDAMEGPTPVSALIHAATMVTAGIFLLYRAPHLVEEIRPFLVALGALTAVFAGTVALFQFDLKRVIAYSTCSQLGFMVVAFGVGSTELSVYHLGNHAFFKALLFLLAGLVIHSLADEQDLRRMGGLSSTLPVSYALFVVGNLALAGFPFLSGFYSKDSIMETLYAKSHWFAYFGCLFGAYLTAYYSFRAAVFVFFGRPRGARPGYLAAAEADPRSLGVVLTLGVFSVFHGYLLRDTFVGWGRPTGWATTLVEAEFATPGWVKLAPLGFSLAAVAVFVAVGVPRTTREWTFFFSKRWWWDAVDSAAARRLLVKSYYLYTHVERGFFEWVGPTGVARAFSRGYDFFRNRGWFTTFWVAGLVGFFFLSGALPAVDALPYVPFLTLMSGNERPRRAG
jgi:proton-translocating NADH-quinone oxidoreductase chain L